MLPGFVFLASPATAMTFTIVHRTPLDAARAQADGLTPIPLSQGMFKLAKSSGSLVSGVIEPPAPFDDLVGSWNADVPAGGSLVMEAQVRVEDSWSKWYELGAVKEGRFQSPESQEDELGSVDVDTLKLRKKASAFRYRFLASAPPGARSLILRLAAVAVSDGDAPAPPPYSGSTEAEIKIKARSQMEEQDHYKNDICSPTSLAMALEYWGVKKATIKTADSVQDRTTGKYGVWPFNVAAAGNAGLEAYVARLDSLNALEAEVFQGRPVIVSITFGAGELDGSPLPKTRGHVVVVAGFTADGDVVVYDPAAAGSKTARRVYSRGQFHGAWRVQKRGLAYLIGRPLSRPMAVGVPTADLWASPRKKAGSLLSDPNHLSQLLYGEPVTILEAKGAWVRIRAQEQANFQLQKKWQGYPGWVKADQLRYQPSPKPNCVVRTRQALLHIGAEILVLSVGTRLQRAFETPEKQSWVRLLDGRLAEIPSDALYVPSESAEDNRHQIIKTAELFLGTSYYWGGRSGVQPDLSIGVDCSGLSSLAYRIQGIDIPRDSHEQKLKSRAVRSRDMKPGDLIFLTETSRDKRITHVILYTGGDGVIESRKSAGRTLRSSFKERFGRPLSEIESGDVVTDYSFDIPRRRVVYFGAYL